MDDPMNKAVSRDVRGVSAEGRRVARGAAQREGKTLGEWLHNAIADQADELGFSSTGMAERHGSSSSVRANHARAADFASRMDRIAREGRDETVASWSESKKEASTDRERNWATDAERRGLRSKLPVEEVDELEVALETLQRRALRSERRTDHVLASIADIMETSEARRSQERDAVNALTEKMASLETKLTDRHVAGDSPIRGALARLEARLDIIGKRSAAESAAVKNGAALAQPGPDAGSVRRLEDKLNAILEAVQIQPAQRAQTSQIALQAAQSREVAAPRRSLGAAIAEIAKHQETLGTPAAWSREDQMRAEKLDLAASRARLGRSVADRMERGASNAASATSVDGGLDGQGRPRVAPRMGTDRAMPRPQSIGGLEQDLRSISQRLDDFRELSPRPGEAPASGTVDPATASQGMRGQRHADPAPEQIERRLDMIAGRMDEALSRAMSVAPLATPSVDTAALEHLVRELGAKIEAVRAPNADSEALDALQRQVERLSSRFERSEQGLAVLPTLAASVRELFDHLEATRANIEASAAHAAREVLRIAAHEGRSRPHDQASTDNVAGSPLDVSDERPTRSLNTVHHMLDQVVDRLSSLESEAATERASVSEADQSPSSAHRQALDKHMLGGVEAARDPIVPLVARGRSTDQTAAPRARNDEPGGAVRRSDFIAAARRAAKTARAEPPAAAGIRLPSASQTDKDARAGLLAKSRDYVASHKRPLLMSLAALLMVLGTITLLQQTGMVGGREDFAGTNDGQSPVAIARYDDPSLGPAVAKRLPSVISSNELTPTALPRSASPLANPIPGSDPIQTGSIPSLPAFAAASRPTQPVLPIGLKTAAEAGNAPAAYDLGSRYADGRSVPRDMKVAAQWLEKAADQGLAPAQYRLASIYEKGLGVPQDKAKAKTLYTQAADAGNPRAMHNLAVMLADGDGHPDYAGAAIWFRKAANYGVHDSQYNLAILLARGMGVQQSLLQSYQWFAIAGAQDDADAARKRDEIAAKLSANELAVAKAFATAFTPKVANPAVIDVTPPVGGWDGAAASSRLNSAKSKVSSL